MDFKRIFLWAIFAISLLILHDNWQKYINKFQPTTSTNSASDQKHIVKSNDSFNSFKESKDLPFSKSEKFQQNLNLLPNINLNADNKLGKLITVTSDLMRAQFDTMGGSLVRLELLKHKDKSGDPVVLFEKNKHHTYIARSGLVGPVDLPNHLMIFNRQLNNLPSKELLTLQDGAKELVFSLTAEKNNLRLKKSYVFKRNSYVIDSFFEIENISQNHTNSEINSTSSTIDGAELYLELVRDRSTIESSYFYSTFTGPAVYSGKEKFKKIEFDDIDSNKAKYPNIIPSGVSSWISMVQHYFVSAWIPDSYKGIGNVYVEKINQDLYRVGIKQEVPALAPGAKATIKARLFAGPQEEHLLASIAPGLELVKDYGWLTIAAKPLFWMMEKIHSLLGNWGWSIVVLTLLIKLMFFPLSAASYKSMARMKHLQPKIAKIREQYQGDSQKISQAMMDIYRTEKINPLGGCLPVLIQIPVFIALYWVLLASVEMRNAPWILWIHDLSVPDPFYILPLLMSGSMLLQIKLNPAPADPTQAKVMLFVQLGFSVMFFFFPAGLVLYWVVNNILSIAQQWQISRIIRPIQKSNVA